MVDAHGVGDADEGSAAGESGGQSPVFGGVGVGEAAGVAHGGGAQDGGGDGALKGGEPEQRCEVWGVACRESERGAWVAPASFVAVLVDDAASENADRRGVAFEESEAAGA